jgi:hypothetical protein
MKMRTRASLKDMAKIKALVWAWAITMDMRYAGKARDFILSWMRVNNSDGDPINETQFEPLIEAYGLLRANFSAAERKQIDAWLRNKADMLWNNHHNRRGNWQSHRLKIVGEIGTAIGDERLWALADDGFKMQLEDSFEPSGVSLDFIKRDALHYHLYSVQPLLALACVAQGRGEMLFDYQAPNGVSLRQAVDFVKPYAFGKMKHIEFVHSQVKFDHKRAEAGETEYNFHQWQPKESVKMFTEAGCMDHGYDAIAAKVNGTPDNPFVNWRAVLNEAGVQM